MPYTLRFINHINEYEITLGGGIGALYNILITVAVLKLPSPD